MANLQRTILIPLICLAISFFEVMHSGNCAAQTTQPTNRITIADILKGMHDNDSAIKSVSFDYHTAIHISPDYQQQLQNNSIAKAQQNNGSPRDPTLEDTTIDGSAKFAGENMLVTVLQKFKNDQALIQSREVSICGLRTFDLDRITRVLTISADTSSPRNEPSLDPRTNLTRFSEGKLPSEMLSDKDFVATIIGKEDILNDQCYKIRLSRVVDMIGKGKREFRKEIWIAPSCGYLLKKAISYSLLDPNTPFNITTYQLQKTQEGVWVYSASSFKSFPVQPTVAAYDIETAFLNYRINESYTDFDFKPNASPSIVKTVVDRISETSYRFDPALLDKLK
jgi:hypothetical protein